MASRELDREVAEQLGYRAKLIDTNAFTGQETWCLLGPDEDICAEGQAIAHSEAGVWEKHLPPFSADLNLALTVIPEWTPERTFMLRQHHKGEWLAAIVDVHLRPEGGHFEARATTPGEATCRAWLEWRKAAK
jgi:hypothetical protein